MALYGIFRKVKILLKDGSTYTTFAIVEQEEIFDCIKEAESYVEFLKEDGDDDEIEVRKL
ncbi:MAG: hypothetical protein ACRC1T_09965 [Clostridium chrysemydis]|uniref:hypothetical protein n=1 Tax=Clostridium chrysemydis TaxID=2665504 RepID=UPI003F2C8384